MFALSSCFKSHYLFIVIILFWFLSLSTKYFPSKAKNQLWKPDIVSLRVFGRLTYSSKDNEGRKGSEITQDVSEAKRIDEKITLVDPWKQQRQHEPRSLLSLPLRHFQDPKSINTKEATISPTMTSNLHVVYFFMDSANTNNLSDSNTSSTPASKEDNLVLDCKEIILHNAKVLSTNTAWQTHVITTNDRLIHLLNSANTDVNNEFQIQVVDFRKLPESERVHRFKQTYVSQSRNNKEYESFCMWRWIVIAEYFAELSSEEGITSSNNHHKTTYPIKNILALDTDVVLVDDPFLTVKTPVDWNVVQSYRIISGAAMIWTLTGLESFVTFLLAIYATPTKAIELAKQHGTIYHQCLLDRSLLIPCFHPDDLNGIINSNKHPTSMWHISDMEWYRAWSRQDLTIRLTRPDPHLIPCYVISHINEEHTYRFVRLGSDNILASPESDEQALKRVCLVHFQGEMKNEVIPFLKFLQGTSPIYYLPPHYQSR